MWLIAGLGNPGRKYARTRHNVGFMVVDELVDRMRLTLQEKSDMLIGRGSIGDETVVLVEPLTFMNRSGSAIRKTMDKSFLPPDRLIVVHDDLDLPVGRLRVRKTGSSGGHRGVESTIQCVGSRDFVRVKIGIGRDPSVPTEEFVLSKFTKPEAALVSETVSRAADAIGMIVSEGVEKAMNVFN